MEPETRTNKKRLSLYLWLLFVPLMIATVAIVFLLRGGGGEVQIEALRKAGFPTSPQELNRWYADVPAASNAALLVVEASAQVGRPGELEQFRVPRAGEAVTDELKEILTAHILRNESALELLHQAASLPSSRYPIDFAQGATSVLPHLGQVKALAQLLRYEGIYHSTEGNRDLALRSVTSGFALARTLRDEPLLISDLVRIACASITLEGLEYLLAEQTLPDGQLKLLDKMLAEAEADGMHAAARALIGERAYALPSFNLSLADYGPQPGPGGNVKQSGTDRLGSAAYRLMGFQRRDLRSYLEMIEGLAAAVTHPFPEALRESDRVKVEMDRQFSSGLGRFAVLSRMVLPSLVKGLRKEAALTTRLRCARTALAVESYRIAHAGSLPKTLDELIPDFLSEIPRDGVEGEPLHFEPLPNGGYEISSPVAGAKLENQRITTFQVLR